jgi:hypothetical protein
LRSKIEENARLHKQVTVMLSWNFAVNCAGGTVVLYMVFFFASVQIVLVYFCSFFHSCNSLFECICLVFGLFLVYSVTWLMQWKFYFLLLCGCMFNVQQFVTLVYSVWECIDTSTWCFKLCNCRMTAFCRWVWDMWCLSWFCCKFLHRRNHICQQFSCPNVCSRPISRSLTFIKPFYA